MFDRFYIDKIFLIRLVLVVGIIGLIILSVNVRVKKSKKEYEEGKVNYVTYGGDEATMVIFNFDKVTRYFVDESSAEPFKRQIAQFIVDSGSDIKQWNTEDVKLDRNEKTLTFTLTNDETYECFIVTKTNELTNIVHEYEQK